MEYKAKIKLKVCGMRDPENILEVAALQPDYIGFIFFAKSPRYVNDNFTIPVNLSAAIKKVGVFVNESTDVMLHHLRSVKLDYLQLHGSESLEQCKELKKQGVKIIKVFSVDDNFGFEITKPFNEVADFFLFDTKGKYHGGNAKVFDWRILKRYDQQVPFFLSGGISPENIKEIDQLSGMNIHALDINSGVESAPGVKDSKEVKKIIDLLTAQSHY